MTLVVMAALLLRLVVLEFVDECTLDVAPVVVSVYAFAWVADFLWLPLRSVRFLPLVRVLRVRALVVALVCRARVESWESAEVPVSVEAVPALEVDYSEFQDRVLVLEQGFPVPVLGHLLSVDLRRAILGLPGHPQEERTVRPGIGLPVMAEKSH